MISESINEIGKIRILEIKIQPLKNIVKNREVKISIKNETISNFLNNLLIIFLLSTFFPI